MQSLSHGAPQGERTPPMDASELRVYLIKASKYDDDGYVVRHWRGVLPSNSLACMAALTDAVAQRGELGPQVRVTHRIVDEAVQVVDVKRIVRDSRLPGVKVVV